MSAISDFAGQVQANFAKIQSGISALDAQIQTLEDSISGSLSPDDQATLASIVAASAALAAAAQAPVTGAVTPTTPAPGTVIPPVVPTPPATVDPTTGATTPVTGSPSLTGA